MLQFYRFLYYSVLYHSYNKQIHYINIFSLQKINLILLYIMIYYTFLLYFNEFLSEFDAKLLSIYLVGSRHRAVVQTVAIIYIH